MFFVQRVFGCSLFRPSIFGLFIVVILRENRSNQNVWSLSIEEFSFTAIQDSSLRTDRSGLLICLQCALKLQTNHAHEGGGGGF